MWKYILDFLAAGMTKESVLLTFWKIEGQMLKLTYKQSDYWFLQFFSRNSFGGGPSEIIIPSRRIIIRSKRLKTALVGWWILTKTILLLRDKCFKIFINLQESLEDKPDVGSSIKITPGSRINSFAMFSLFLCPPLIIFFSGDPTFKSLISKIPSNSKISLILLFMVWIESFWHKTVL